MRIIRRILLFWDIVKKRSAMPFLSTQLDSRNALLVGIITTALVFAASCKNIRTGGMEANANSTNSSSPLDENKSKGLSAELSDKKAELAKLSPPLKLDPKAVIKGKALLVGNLKTVEETFVKGEISPVREATSLDELETLIQVVCSKGRFLANYEKGVKGYANDCKVSLVDYRAPAVIAQKTVSNSEREEVILERDVRNGEYVTPAPVRAITKYLDGFQIDKELFTSGGSIEENELIRLPTSVNLNPNATIKDKIKIVERDDSGPVNQWSVNTKVIGYEKYGFPDAKFTFKPEELGTLVRILCSQGSLIGKVDKVTEYSSKCEVSLIDYKSLTVFAQQTVENKSLEQNVPNSSSPGEWIVSIPKQEIARYLKSFPASSG